MTIQNLKENNHDFNKESVINFAVACYEMNSIEELKDIVKKEKADETDMREWGINESQFFAAVFAAIGEKESELEDIN